ncbi:MAG: iron ABC transporter permease [Desulfobacteraceae bacterium]|nr:iron ABC transporter permease [Desulfobacteraceae bacterium]
MTQNIKKILYTHTVWEFFLLVIVLWVAVLVSAGMGYMNIGFYDVVNIIVTSITGNSEQIKTLEEVARVIVMDVRLPRILCSVIVGAGLAVSGCVYQGILLNPLADPYTLGISGGAAFGASLAFLFFPEISLYVVPCFAFSGAVITLFVVIWLSSGKTFSRDGLSSNSLILSGIIVASILSAGISFLKYIADEEVSVIIFWLMGSFASKTWTDVWILLIIVSMGSLVIYFYSRDLNVIALGSRMASTLGINTGRVTMVLLITASLVAAVCVSVSGIIGFVGLLVPHMMRSVTGPDNTRLIPVCLLSGGILLVTADTITRAVLPVEVPIGVLTALIGGPFFCYVFRRNHLKNRGKQV